MWNNKIKQKEKPAIGGALVWNGVHWDWEWTHQACCIALLQRNW